MTTDGRILDLYYPTNYPSIGRASEFIDTHPDDFMTAADACKVVACIKKASQTRSVIVDFRVFWSRAIADRIGRIISTGKNEVIMLQGPPKS